jgi:hypothetical protein
MDLKTQQEPKNLLPFQYFIVSVVVIIVAGVINTIFDS